MALPCNHQQEVVDQVQPTINLLNDLDQLHPNVLLEHGIQPADYQHGLVFRSAIESIRGKFIASSTTGREAMVGDVLENMRQRHHIEDYKQRGSRNRFDFEVEVAADYFAALEVKGGEGNSINISERPLWAKEFIVWSHLDGAVVNQPKHGAHAIINRLTNEMVLRNKQVDALLFKDGLCGTRTRPCPKYPGQETTIGLVAAPDIFLFPQRIPTLDDPEPICHSLNTLRLPKLILKLFGIQPAHYSEHVWYVSVEVVPYKQDRARRYTRIRHLKQIVDESISRSWKP